MILLLVLLGTNFSFSQNDTLFKRFLQVSGNISVPTDYTKKHTPCFNPASCIIKTYDYYNLLSYNISIKYIKQNKPKFTFQTGGDIIIENNYKTAINYDTTNNENYFYKMSNGELILNRKQILIYIGVVVGYEYHFDKKHSVILNIVTKLPFYYANTKYTSFSNNTEDRSEILTNEWWLDNFFYNMYFNLNYNYQISNTVSCFFVLRNNSFATISPFYIGLGIKYKLK